MTPPFIIMISIIYFTVLVLKRWKTLARHDTFNAIMWALVGWAAIEGVVGFIVLENYRAMVVGVSTLGYVISVGAYFYFDYRKVHKRRRVQSRKARSLKKQWKLRPDIKFVVRREGWNRKRWYS